MATITNQATTTYQYDGSSETQTIESNPNSITLEETSGLLITKNASTSTFVNGTIITYTITIANSSSSFLTGVRIIDDLGGGNLAYVVGSGRLATSTQSYAVNPIDTSPLTFTLQQLAEGASMTLVYSAQVLFNLPETVSTITNTVRGIGYTSTGTITGSDTSTITRGGPSSGVISSKTTSVQEVSPRQPISYFIGLRNTSSTPVIYTQTVDQLAPNFVITSIQYRIGSGTTQTLSDSDYTLSSSNFLTIPSSIGPSITIPANGETLLTINGYFE